MATKSFYALIAGAGPGTGRAIASRFAQAYPVVLLARNAETLNDTVDEIKKLGGQAIGISTDVGDPSAVDRALALIKEALPGSQLAAAVYNINAGFLVKPFLDLKPEEFNTGVAGVTNSFFNFAQKTLPLLLEARSTSPNPPTLIVTGATASLKASSNFASFAAGKFALRAMSQSLAREFGPQGIHVAHAVIDGLIDTQATRQYGTDGGPDSKIDPDAIAQAYWHLHTQPRSAFTHEIDIRPFSESF
ncbi:hypothetical protein ACHAQA_004973 [Verticillium albo-atrum]